MFDVYAQLPDVLAQLRRSLTGVTSHAITTVHGASWETWQAPLRAERDEITGVVGVSLDVTESKRIDDELRAKLALVEKQREPSRFRATRSRPSMAALSLTAGSCRTVTWAL